MVCCLIKHWPMIPMIPMILSQSQRWSGWLPHPAGTFCPRSGLTLDPFRQIEGQKWHGRAEDDRDLRTTHGSDRRKHSFDGWGMLGCSKTGYTPNSPMSLASCSAFFDSLFPGEDRPQNTNLQPGAMCSWASEIQLRYGMAMASIFGARKVNHWWSSK